MDHDLLFVGGLLIGILSVPTILSAAIEGRFPKFGFVLLLLGAGMVGYVVYYDTTKYSFQQIPEVVARVVGKIF